MRVEGICTYMKRDTEKRCRMRLVGARETLNSLQQCTATDCNRLQHMYIHEKRHRKETQKRDTEKRVADWWGSVRRSTHCNNALQQTATDCNRLQQTATDCNSLQHAATYGNTLQHTATCCNRHTCRSESEKATLLSVMNTMKLTAERQKGKEKG